MVLIKLDIKKDDTMAYITTNGKHGIGVDVVTVTELHTTELSDKYYKKIVKEYKIYHGSIDKDASGEYNFNCKSINNIHDEYVKAGEKYRVTVREVEKTIEETADTMIYFKLLKEIGWKEE